LQLFSFKGLLALLRRSGFSSVVIRTHGTNPHEMLSVMWPGLVGSKRRQFDRVQSSRSLNDFMSSGRLRPLVKSAVNQFLDATHLGDSLKVVAS
jgi:hypothetical protein